MFGDQVLVMCCVIMLLDKIYGMLYDITLGFLSYVKEFCIYCNVVCIL